MKQITKKLRISYLVLTLAPMTMQARLTPELIQQFTKPITFNRSAIQLFLSDILHHRLYGTYILPAGFGHLMDFLGHQKTVGNPAEYTLSIFELFHNRLKESNWVNPYALAQLIDVIAQQCEPLCANTKQSLNAQIKHTLYQALLTRFHDLKKDPDNFMTEVSKEIVSLVDAHNNQTRTELRYAITRFIESALDKIIWDPHEQEACWENCKKIADQLNTLYQVGIIPSETQLNHCFWSLIYRFCYFIETVGEHLKAETYQLIQQDIARKNSCLLLLAEQEEGMMTKAKWLHTIVFEAEVKIRSQASNIYTTQSK